MGGGAADRRVRRAVLEDRPHPDGLGIWAEGGRDIVFLLEYDTGSEHLPRLAGYSKGNSGPVWARAG